VFCNVYQQWFPNGNASVFAGFMFDAFDSNKVFDDNKTVFLALFKRNHSIQAQ